MKRLAFISVLVICLLIASMTTPDNGTPPAQAGDGYWSQTNCTEYNGNPDPRLNIWWNGRSYGVYYWLEGYSEQYGAKLVWGNALAQYASLGYQCGWLGAPLTDRYYDSQGQRQDFQYGILRLYVD